MRRRSILALFAGAAAPPFVVRAADEPVKVFRLGILSPLPAGPGIRAFVQRLQQLGWEEGRNLQIDYVQVDSTDAARSRVMAAELAGRGVETIFAGGPEMCLSRRWR